LSQKIKDLKIVANHKSNCYKTAALVSALSVI